MQAEDGGVIEKCVERLDKRRYSTNIDIYIRIFQGLLIADNYIKN